MKDNPVVKPRVHHFVQAPVRPLDPDGIVVGIIGTTAFTIVSIVLCVMRERLISAGLDWWLPTAIAGTVLGLIGTGYCYYRKLSRKSH